MQARKSVPVSNMWKFSVIGVPSAQPSKTQTGITNTEICTAEPTALPRQISILFFQANISAAACSAALPTMGIRMPVRKRIGTCSPLAAPLIVLTIISESDEINVVITASQKMPPHIPSIGASSSSSPSASSKRCVCVDSWNKIRSPYSTKRITEIKRESQSGASPPGTLSTIHEAEPSGWWSVVFRSTGLISFLIGLTISWTPPLPWRVASKMEGRESANTATMSTPTFVIAATLLNLCSLCLVPPTINAEPKTSSRLESTEPNIEACTTLMKPRLNAWMQTTSSVTLPNDAFRSPPTVGFVYFETSSVTKDTRSAKGMRASNAKLKV
mmetsp:Transcript_46523/g.92476  ORF Transcript_46523/g.92476 Transcript_46523/m.92476 type:complete len:329 (+) Transcript_46523:507-1493(+)